MMKKSTNTLFRIRKGLSLFTLLLITALFANPLFAQNGKVVSGTVLDQDGNPVSGAQVFVPQTTIKTKTNDKGTYLLNLPTGVNSFVVTAKGKQRQQVSVGDKTTVNVRMMPFSNKDLADADDDLANNGGKKKKKIKTPKGERAVVGTVTDEGGQPVPSASVIIAGTQTGTLTDLDGRFMLTIPAGRDSLAVSFVGFETQIIEIGDNEGGINVIMRETELSPISRVDTEGGICLCYGEYTS